jgi:penicillin-binding protein 2
LYLTLDMRMQKIAQEALTDQAGAVVGVNPKNGEILFMASNPTFSSNDFVEGMTTEKWKELIENPLHPLENRAVAGRYPPGSTFKIVSAAAILEEKIATVDTRVVCRGAYPLGDRDFHCWNRGGHGAVDFHHSLLQSCDIYYYDMSLKLGIDNLAKYARAFGLGAASGVELSGEQSGVVPDKAWKKEKLGRNWTLGETLNAVIGQGYTLATPLQMAMATSVIANGGVLYKPSVVRKITDAEDNLVRFFQPEVVRDLQLDPATVKAVQAGLVGVVNSPGGTGGRSRVADVVVAGKTGTAQVIALGKYKSVRGQDRPYKYRDHAWFIAYAPADDPQVAMAVLVEHGGGGGAAAAPIAQKILDAFFHPQPETPQNGSESAPKKPNG